MYQSSPASRISLSCLINNLQSAQFDSGGINCQGWGSGQETRLIPSSSDRWPPLTIKDTPASRQLHCCAGPDGGENTSVRLCSQRQTLTNFTRVRAGNNYPSLPLRRKQSCIGCHFKVVLNFVLRSHQGVVEFRSAIASRTI